jgi:hypothetical protein
MRSVASFVVLLGLPTPTVTRAQPIPIVFMEFADLHALMAGDGPPVLVDVPGPDKYPARHIVGARSIPLRSHSGQRGFRAFRSWCSTERAPHHLASLAYERLWE